MEGDAVRVCLRVRPLIQREQGEEVNLLWKEDGNTILQVDGTKSFSFDRVFHSHETTAQVYQEVAVPIIRSALQGYNGTIFAYGQTSSGKTYTMMGTPNSLGIIPQAVQEIFKIIHEIPNREFLLRVSYMEIYNESVTDLLCDDRKKKPLEIREDINRNVFVAELTEELVMAPEHIMQWIKKGEKNRHYGETKMNDHSSRSHTIFRMIVESRERNEPGNSENCDGAVMVSHLNLVDLAGSERASQTGAEGVRLKEGCNINRSLFILGQVIKKLSDGQVGGFINYRDSKLTRILQNSLGGNTKTVIICTVTPVSLDETLSTLQFASTAKHVRNTPHVNEVLDDQALLKRYRKEIMSLKKQLEGLEESSDTKTHAMAKEERSQLLAEIQQLQKEKEDRIWNLTNIVVASSQQSHEDQRLKRKRRVTWAPGKFQDSLHVSKITPFEFDSRLTANYPKRPKVFEISPIPEIDDSICTEFSDFEDASRGLEDVLQDADYSFDTKVTRREKTAALSYSMIDFPSDSTSALSKDSSLRKCKELEQKVAELENQLSKLTKEYDTEVGKRESLERETTDLRGQLKSREEKDELVQTLELEVTSLKDQIHRQTECSEHSPVPGDCFETNKKSTPLKMDDEPELVKMTDSALEVLIDAVCQEPIQEKLSRDSHDPCREHIQMLELKIVDLEGNKNSENVDQSDLRETIQICEALMAEKQSAQENLVIMQNKLDPLVEENESLKEKIAYLEKHLQEKQENNEFEMLEKETQKEQEAQLIHEISSLKKVIENAEVYNQELENEVESKSKLLKELEKQVVELKKESEILQKKVKYSDLSASLGDGEKLCEEVFKIRQSLTDAETVTRDAQREAAFLRSENLELKERMDELSIRCEIREKNASDYAKQLEVEKSNYKTMQADLQKELQYAFKEINQLNGLMAGRVPNDLLSRFELDKKVADLSKQLASLLEEKNALAQEVAGLLEYKSLPSEVEHLKDQVQRTSEELMLLKNEKEQSASIIIDQKHKLLEQAERIEKMTEEVTHVQAKCQQAEEQYSTLKILHESLEEKSSLAAKDLNKKDSEAQSLFEEMDKLKHSMGHMEEKLSSMVEEKNELINARQALETQVKELEELLKCSHVENDSLQGQVNDLSSDVTTLQQQREEQSQVYKDKQDLEEKYNALVSEKQQLQEQLHVSSLTVMQLENTETSSKLQELQAELKLAVQHRDELLVKMEELEAEKDGIKQDLNENIELSIETQDELRTTQEELKQQKQLVADLRKQLDDCAGDTSPQAESQRADLEEKLSMLTETLEENKVKYETLTNEKLELESVYQSLISEMKLLQERALSAELVLSKVEEENDGLKLKMEEQLISAKDLAHELMNSSTRVQEQEILEGDLHRQIKQEYDLQSLELKEQMLAVRQEKDALHETLESITAERDQLKLDLQENVEMSIDTQEELRSALDELKVKTQLLESLSAQMDEVKVGNNEASNAKEYELISENEDLKEQLKTIQKQLKDSESKEAEVDGCQEQRPEYADMEMSLLEEKVTKGPTLLEDMQEEKLELLNKLGLLQEELEKGAVHRDELQCKLDSVLNENGHLKERLDSVLACSSRTQEELQRCQEELNHQIAMINNLKIEASSRTSCEEKETTTDLMPPFEEEEVLALQEKLLQKNTEYQQLNQDKENLEQDKALLSSEVEGLIREMKETQSVLESLQSEKLETGRQLLDLQQQIEIIVQERDHLKNTQQRCVSITDQESQTENNDQASHFENEVEQRTTWYHQEDLIQSNLTLSNNLELLKMNLKNSEEAVESLQSEKNNNEQKLICLQHQVQLITEELENLKQAQQCVISERDQLKEDSEKNVEKLFCLQEEALQNANVHQELIQKREELEQGQMSLKCEIEDLTKTLMETRSTLEELQKEKLETEQQLATLQQKMDGVTQEKDELQTKKESLTLEMASLKEKMMNLEENQQRIPANEEAMQTPPIHYHALDNVKNSEAELTSLRQDKSNMEERLFSLEQQVGIMTHERDELKVRIQSLLSERDQLKEDLRENVEMSIEVQNDLRKTQDDLQQHKQEVEDLTCKIASLEQKSSLVERELQETVSLLKEANNENQTLQQSKQTLVLELEHLQEDIKNKELAVEELERMRSEADQKVIDLTELLKTLSKEKDQMQLKEEEFQKQFQDELERTREEIQQKEQRVEELNHEISVLEQQVARLQDELATSHTQLQSMKQERDDSNAHLADKVNEVNEMLQEISYLREQMQQLGQEMKDEKIKNCDLCENVNLLETEIRVLRSVLSEPAQEEDELAESTEILERKNQEWKDLMVNLSTVYSDHYNLLNNLSSELLSETEVQKQSMNSIKESLSSTLSRAFGNLQAEHTKLNAQMQTLLNKFKIIYRNAAVKEEHYNLVKEFESELCTVQKNNDELLLQCESLEQHGTKWSDGAAEDLKFRELEFLNQLIFKKLEVMKVVEDDFSEVQAALNNMAIDLKKEIKSKKDFIIWLDELKGLHVDPKKLSDGVLAENRRIAELIQLLTKKLKLLARSKTKQDTMKYLSSLETDLKEKKEKNKELLQKMQQISPSGDCNILEEENAQLRRTLKNVQADLKKMQCRIQDLENELRSAKADTKQKEHRALLLEEKLHSSTAESELSEMRVRMNEKENHYQVALKEIQVLQEKVGKGAAPYRDEIESLKSQVMRIEMDRMKLSKSTDQQIASLKACIEDKEERLRKLKEQLRRTQIETETTICSGNSISPTYPLTCGGGSGIVQSTALLMLQSENAGLKREIAQYKKKLGQLSRNIYSHEEELKKLKDRSETPTTLLSSVLHEEAMSHSKTDFNRAAPVSPRKSEMPTGHIASPGKTGTFRKCVLSPCKTDKPQPMSPKKERYSVPAVSPGNTGRLGKRPASPFQTDGPLFSTLTKSPCKKQIFPEKVDSPKEKFFDVRSKSLPYCPSKFFDNSNLGTLPDADFRAGMTTETSDGNNWWDQAGKTEKPDECKTS